jgi:hypothetical protein
MYEGKMYTSSGVEVPAEVHAEDVALLVADQPLAPDEQVLNMVVTLPAEALPEHYSLSPLEPPPDIPDNTLPPEGEGGTQSVEDDEEEEVEEEVEEDTPQGKKVVKKTVKRKKAAKRK